VFLVIVLVSDRVEPNTAPTAIVGAVKMAQPVVLHSGPAGVFDSADAACP
jgi:hypothetical protein